MSKFEVYEIGKGMRTGATIEGNAHICINADGTKPRMSAQFNDTLNELVGVMVLVDKWQESFPMHYTVGKTLRKDYANALGVRKGVFTMEATLLHDYTFGIELSFIDTSSSDFEIVSFKGILFDPNERTIQLPQLENDDHTVFLEESLVGMLKPGFEAVIARCSKIGFVNKLYHGFTVNRYGVCVDQRDRTLVQVCR